MNKVSLLTLGKKLQDGNLYLLSVYDLEPSGIIIHAYDQLNSKEYTLPISEFELASASYSRNKPSLSSLIETIEIMPQGADFVLQSTDDRISKIKQRLLAEELEQLIRQPLTKGGPGMNELIVTGLLELCKVKPVGMDAVQWLGDWFLANNPQKPNVISPDDE